MLMESIHYINGHKPNNEFADDILLFHNKLYMIYTIVPLPMIVSNREWSFCCK